MSAFSEAALEKKLSELSNSQQSVQTLSLWLIHHRKHSRPIVTVWERELRKEFFSNSGSQKHGPLQNQYHSTS
uniref:Regulation of nuclear pre-mRNA domain containing 1A n=1 Tax=Ovis aries TaxID=9940 RepID=A0AC11EC82_SHEEP